MLGKAFNFIRGGIFLLLSFILTNPASLSANPNIFDFTALRSLGVSEDTMELIMRNSLSPRARAPMEADFVYALAAYGGDPLTRAYLKMDTGSSHNPKAPISQADLTRMMRNRVAVKQMIAAIDASLYGSEENEDSLYSAPSAGGESEITVSDIPSDFNNTGPILAASAVGAAPAVGAALGSGGIAAGATGAGAAGSASGNSLPSGPISEISPEYTSSSDSLPFERSQMENDALELNPFESEVSFSGSGAPSPASEDTLSSPPARSMNPLASGDDYPIRAMEKSGSGFANKAPHPLLDLESLPATPSAEPKENNLPEEAQSPVPEELGAGAAASPYPVREPDATHTFYMGSYETVTPDGHRVDVHRNSRSGFLGTRVESTASGKKVHRAFSGKTESVEEGARGSDAPKQKRNPLGGTPVKASDFLP